MIILWNKPDNRVINFGFGHNREEYLIELSSTINALPGIRVLSAFEGVLSVFENSGKPVILFQSNEGNQDGLFFLTRCIDNRYFVWGRNWEINLSVGDTIYDNGDRPIVYELTTTSSNFKHEIVALIHNLNHHFHNDIFMDAFKLNRDTFQTIDTIVENRNIKINQILI
jgi:hypothetical protein